MAESKGCPTNTFAKEYRKAVQSGMSAKDFDKHISEVYNLKLSGIPVKRSTFLRDVTIADTTYTNGEDSVKGSTLSQRLGCTLKELGDSAAENAGWSVETPGRELKKLAGSERGRKRVDMSEIVDNIDDDMFAE